MVEGVTIGIGGHCGSSSSSHSSSSSSSSSKGKDITRLLIHVSSSVQTDRIHSFFDRSLSLAKPPIGAGFVKRVHRKSDDTVIVSIEDSSIARRLFSSFSDSRPKIDGHEFTIEFYRSEHSKSLSSPSNHNGDKKRDKESKERMTSCSSIPSPSSSSKRQSYSYSSPSTSRPSTSTHESTRKECGPSSSSPVNPYSGIVGVSIHSLPEMSEGILKEVLRAGLREIGGYLTHYNEGGTKVLLKRSSFAEEMEPQGTLNVQGEETTFITMSMDETHRLYDRYSSNHKSRDSIPSTSSSSSSFHPSRYNERERNAMSYESSRTIFLPCLPKGVTKEYIRKRFHKIGTVLDMELKNIDSISPHAIVQFSHTQGAVHAMEDYEREQREEGMKNPMRNKKSPHFVRSSPSTRVWVANLPPHDEDYVKKKLLELLKGAQNPTIVVDLRRREGIIDFSSLEKAKQYLETFKSSPVVQQGGSVHTWLVSDYCSQYLYDNFIERRGQSPFPYECDYISTLMKMQLSEKQKIQAEERMERLKGGDEKTTEKKKSMNGENGNHAHSPSSSRRFNGEDRRSGDSGFSEDRDKGATHALESDDDEVLEAKWNTGLKTIDLSGENGKMGRRMLGVDESMASFINDLPKTEKVIKKEIKEEEDGEKKENEKIPRVEKVNMFRDALLTVTTTPFKGRSIEELHVMRGREKDPLKSPSLIPISPCNSDRDRKHIIGSPPIGRPAVALHINIPPSTSTIHSISTPSPYTRIHPSSSNSSSRHPSISTPSTLTPRSHTLPSNNRPPFPPNDHNGDHQWNGGGSNVGTPTSSRLPLSRRESVCSNSSQSYTPLPPSQPSTSQAGVYTPNAIKSPTINTWNSSSNTWKGGPSLPSPLPSSINRSRQSIDSHHKSSAPSLSRPLGLPKSSMDKSGFGLGPSSSHPKTPVLPRSTSMSEKRPPNISRDSSKDIVNSILQNERDVKKMPRIPKKENRERDEKEERREKKREEKDREKREDREERKEKKKDRKKSRENETKDEKAVRKEGKKKKEKEKEERKKNMNEKEKKRKSIDGGEKKKKKKQKRTSSDSESDSDEESFKPGSSSQMKSDEALARLMSGGSMYDRVKGRRSGTNKEDKRKNDIFEELRKKKGKKTKRVLLSDSDEDDDESIKKMKKNSDEESTDEEEKERIKKEKKEKKKKRERKESGEESDSDGEKEKERREEEKRKKKEKKVAKKSSIDLFSDADSEKSVIKEKLSKKRSHEKEEECSPSTSNHPPPEKKMKKEETSSSGSESEGERSSKKSEISTSSWRGREGKRLSESSIATHSEKDFGRNEDAWKSPMSGNGEKEIKEEPKEEPHPPRLLTKAAMKEFNTPAASSPLAGPSWNREEKGDEKDSSESSQSSTEDEEETEEREEREEKEEKKDEEEEDRREEMNDAIEERIEEEEKEEEVEIKMEEDTVERKDEEEIEEKKEEEERVEEEEKEEVKIEEEEEESKSLENDSEAESAVRGLELPSDDVIEETEKAVESIFDDEEEPEALYPSADFITQTHDLNLSSSSSQSSSPKIPSTSHNLSSSLLHRPTPIHPSSISSPSILSPSHHHLLQSHHSIPSSSPLVSPHFIGSPSTSRPSSIHNFNVRPISQESSSQHVQDENGVLIQQEKSWTPQGSSSDGPSPSPNHHPISNTQEIVKKFPVKWQGKVEVKKNEINTSWHKVHGNEELLNTMFPAHESSIRVTGKFRLENDSIRDLVDDMMRSDDNACLVVTPAGSTVEDVNRNSKLFSEHLVDFFVNKKIAGVIEFSTPDGKSYRCHMFAPGDVMNNYLSTQYPDFLQLLNVRYPNKCLLALFKRKEE